MVLLLLLLIVLVALSGLFSGAEIAYFSLSPARIQTLIDSGRRGAQQVSALKKKPQRLLTTILLGNNIANIAAASVATAAMIQSVGSAAVGVTTGVMTLVILVFGEVLPKSVSMRNADRIALATAPLFRVLVIIVRPVAWALALLFPGGMRDIPIVTEEELRAMTTLGLREGAVEQDEAEIIHNVFRLNDVTADRIMTPRSRMQTIAFGQNIRDIRDTLLTSSYSRIPVMGEDRETVVGILYKDDALAHLAQDRPTERRVEDVARSPLFVPETKTADDLLDELRAHHVHMAIVVNRYGEVTGLVTLEDLLEELVGEIFDEHDREPRTVDHIAEGDILVSGDTEIQHINAVFQADLDEDSVTVGGLLMERAGRILRSGDRLMVNNILFDVVEADETRVQLVRIIKH